MVKDHNTCQRFMHCLIRSLGLCRDVCTGGAVGFLLVASAFNPPGVFAQGPNHPMHANGPESDQAEWLALVHVDVLTMTSEQPLPDQTVLIHGDRISMLAPSAEVMIPEGARVIDGRGHYLLPGLIDLHVHLDEGLGVRPDFADGPLYLSHGVTTVLNMRGDESHLRWRQRIEEGKILAPTLFTAGEFLNEPLVTTPDQVEAEVRRQAEAGFDVIKFHEYFSAEERRYLTTVGLGREAYDRMITTARDVGIPLVGHAPHNLGLEPVLEMGQSLAHLNTLVEHHFIPDGLPKFARFANLTKWSALTLLFATALALGIAGVGGTRAGSAGSLFTWRLGIASLGGTGLFLVVWEHTVWAGNDGLVALLWASGLVIVSTTLLLVRRLATAWATGDRSRSVLLLLLLPSVALAFSLVYWLPLAWRNTEGRLDTMAKALHDAEVSIVTTLVVDSPTWLGTDRQELRYVSAASGWHGFEPFQYSAPWWAPDLKVSQWRFLERKLVTTLYHAEVSLLLGTDSMGYPMIIPGISVHGELALLREAGLTTFEALRTATVLPARFLGQGHEVGSVAQGLRADLLLVAGNPLEDLSRLERPAAVVLRGQWLDRPKLDGLLETLTEPGTRASE